MKRLAYTIILNGEKHLLHNNYAKYLLDNVLDYWVIIEGACHSTGSTYWCVGDNSDYHKNGHSIDNTLEILEDLQKKYSTKFFYFKNECDVLWNNKDEMVNAAIQGLKDNGYNEGWLYQIDIDEQWKLEDMMENESYMLKHNAKSGDSKFYQYVGKDIIADGPNWGGNTITRLWNWKGEFFKTHEPPRLMGNNEPFVLLPKKYHHYSYYYEDDVKFKCDWYNYGNDFFQRWKKLQSQIDFPRPLSELFQNYYSINGKIIKI